MDKFDFMKMVSEILEVSTTEDEIDMKANDMIDTVNLLRMGAKSYLKIGIL